MNKDDSNIMHRKEREKKKLTFSSFLKRSRPQSWFLFFFLNCFSLFPSPYLFSFFWLYSTSTHFARKAFHSLGLWELQQSEEKRRKKRREITAKAFLNVQSTLNFFPERVTFFCFSLISSEKMFVCQSCR